MRLTSHPVLRYVVTDNSPELPETVLGRIVLKSMRFQLLLQLHLVDREIRAKRFQRIILITQLHVDEAVEHCGIFR